MITRDRLLVPLLIAAALLVACGSSDKAAGVFALGKGMTPKEVRATAGPPYRIAAPGKHWYSGCWFFHAVKKGTSIDGAVVCFKRGRVSKVGYSHHL